MWRRWGIWWEIIRALMGSLAATKSVQWLVVTMSIAAYVRTTYGPGAAHTLSAWALVLLPLERLGYAVNAATNNRLRHQRWLRSEDLSTGRIESGRLVLERPRWSDREAILAMFLDAEAIRANGWRDADASGFESWNSSRLLFRIVHRYSLACRLADGEPPVALVSLAPIDVAPRPGFHLGITVHPEHRGRGHGGAALRAALPSLWVDRPVWLGTSTDNTAVRRIMARLGYPEPVPEPHTLPNGTTVDGLWYRLQVGRIRATRTQ